MAKNPFAFSYTCNRIYPSVKGEFFDYPYLSAAGGFIRRSLPATPSGGFTRLWRGGFIRISPACLVIFASNHPIINGNARRRLRRARFLEVIIIKDCLTKPNKCGINNKIQKIRKSLGCRKRQLTFTPFLLGIYP